MKLGRTLLATVLAVGSCMLAPTVMAQENVGTTEFILKVENTTPYIIIEMSRDLGYDDPVDMLDAIANGHLSIQENN